MGGAARCVVQRLVSVAALRYFFDSLWRLFLEGWWLFLC